MNFSFQTSRVWSKCPLPGCPTNWRGLHLVPELLSHSCQDLTLLLPSQETLSPPRGPLLPIIRHAFLVLFFLHLTPSLRVMSTLARPREALEERALDLSSWRGFDPKAKCRARHGTGVNNQFGKTPRSSRRRHLSAWGREGWRRQVSLPPGCMCVFFELKRKRKQESATFFFFRT